MLAYQSPFWGHYRSSQGLLTSLQPHSLLRRAVKERLCHVLCLPRPSWERPSGERPSESQSPQLSHRDHTVRLWELQKGGQCPLSYPVADSILVETAPWILPSPTHCCEDSTELLSTALVELQLLARNMRYPESLLDRRRKEATLRPCGQRERLHLALTKWKLMAGTLADTYQAQNTHGTWHLLACFVLTLTHRLIW